MSTEALKRAIKLAGGQTNLAKSVGLSQPYIWNWLNRDRSVPAEYVIPVSQATSWQVTPNQLRPDIYPNDVDGLPTSEVAVFINSGAIKPIPSTAYTQLSGGGYIYSIREFELRMHERREAERRNAEHRDHERRS